MAPRRDVSLERKTQILDAALRVFARKGFHKARMDDIAKKAGLSKGLLYWYFESKDALILALVKLLFEPDLRELERLLAEKDRPVPERLEELARSSLSALLPFHDLMPIVYEYYAQATRPGPIQKAVQRYYQRYRELLAKLLAEGVARGELRPDLDPEQTALSLMALVEGMVLMWVVGPERKDIQNRWDSVARQVLDCLLPVRTTDG